jgi:hypothetical protein
MKFTKTEVKENILASLGNTRKLSERSIDEMIANAMVFAGEETELADFVKNLKPMVVTANTNLIKDQTDFVKDWEAKNPKPAETVKKDDIQQPDFSALEALLEKKLSPLQQELEGYRIERTTESIFGQARDKFLAENKLDSSNERVKSIQDYVFSTIKPKVGKDSNVEDISTQLKAEFEKLAKVAGIDSPYIPAEPSGGGGDSAAAEFANATKILQNAGKLPAPEQKTN